MQKLQVRVKIKPIQYKYQMVCSIIVPTNLLIAKWYLAKLVHIVNLSTIEANFTSPGEQVAKFTSRSAKFAGPNPAFLSLCNRKPSFF